MVILLSGGIDSTVLLYQMAKGGHIDHALSFDYGARHNRMEIKYAKKHAKRLNIPHGIIKLDLSAVLKSALLGDIEVPQDIDYADPMQALTIVPFRNPIMLSVAAGYALSVGSDGVAIATHKTDQQIYPDCRPEFNEAMANVIEIVSEGKLRLYAPYAEMSKVSIVRLGMEIGVDIRNTYSCYVGEEQPCGKCGTCTERDWAINACLTEGG